MSVSSVEHTIPKSKIADSKTDVEFEMLIDTVSEGNWSRTMQMMQMFLKAKLWFQMRFGKNATTEGIGTWPKIEKGVYFGLRILNYAKHML